MDLIKNIEKSKVLELKEEVIAQPGQVVSKTLAQNDAVSILCLLLPTVKESALTSPAETLLLPALRVPA